MPALTRLCQTMAGATARPVWRSQRMVVSRWLVTPIAARLPAASAALCQGCAGRCELRRPDRLGVVLDDARRRQDLRKLLLGGGDDPAGMIEDDRPARGGALVEGEDVLGHGSMFSSSSQELAVIPRSV